MKKLLRFLLTLLIIPSLASCDTRPDTRKGYFEYDDAPEGAICMVDDNKALKNDNTTLVFKANEDGTFGVYFYNDTLDKLYGYNDKPARLSIRGADSFGVYEVKEYEKGYDGVEVTNYGYYCVSIVTTKAQSQFRVMDSYYISKKTGISLYRKVSVITAKSKDVGYESIYTIKNGANSTVVDNFDFLIPSTLYKDAKYNASSALITSLYNSVIYVKETRCGLPMTMIRDKTSQNYISLVHAEPKITVNDIIGGGSDGTVDDDLEYGSLGFETEKTIDHESTPIDLAISYCYPCAEGPATFDSGSGWSRRFHQISEKHFHEYKLGLVFGTTETFNDALVEAYENCYSFVDQTSDYVSNEMIYQQNIDCLHANYKEFDKKGVVSYGVPWSIYINEKQNHDLYSFQSGFVGQQTSVGAHLYRQGLVELEKDPSSEIGQKYLTEGQNMVNFWCSKTILPDGNKLPYIWFDGCYGIPRGSGESKYQAIYLRQLCDGLEGILDAYLYGLEFGKEDHPEWLEFCLTVAKNLIETQNDDGSFNRCFKTDGGIPDDTFNDKNIGYDASDPLKFKLNTPFAVRYLAKLYNTLDKTAYAVEANLILDSLIKATDFSYQYIYVETGKYVGGAIDNPNVTDRESAIFSMYAFRYAYEICKEKLSHCEPRTDEYIYYGIRAENYYKATIHATCCAMSWVFFYDFACPSNEEDEPYCAFTKGNTMGMSAIATGHAAVDGFAAYMWYDMYKVYEMTGKDVYKKAAIALSNACKKFTDYKGEMGWQYKCLFAEACQVSDFYFKPTTSQGNAWLPWCAIAQINPMIAFYMDYGVWNIEDLEVNAK